MLTEPIIYRIDAKDRICGCNDAWISFAQDNEGEESLPEQVVGRLLWEVVTDPTLQELYQRMVAKARTGQPVQFRYRCDAPNERRVFHMTLRGEPGGVVEFRSELKSYEERPSVEWLKPHAATGKELVRLCSWCARVFVEGLGWVSIERAIERHGSLQGQGSPKLTHGMCEDCRDEMLQLLANPAAKDLNQLPV